MGIATKSTVDTFFPKKNPKNKNDTNRDWLTIELKSNYDATQAVNDYNKLSTTLMTQTLMNTNPTDPGAANNIIDLIDNNITITDPSLHQNVFGFSSLLGMVIALAIMVLLIGILVGVLYRVPGIFAFLAILATVSMTVMTLLLAGYTLSLGMIIGALVIAFVSLIVALGFGERIKRQLKSGVKFNAAVRTGLKKGI
jgi:SecD/SecF fusion protein